MAETGKTKPKAPANLGARARRMWRDVVGPYQLRPDELLILERACRELDVVERIEGELAGDSLTARGSMGQPVAHPLVGELRQHTNTLRSLLASLNLPDEDGRAGESRSSSARAAANSRWRRGA